MASQTIIISGKQQAQKEQSMTFRMIVSIFGAVLGSAQYGYNMAVINSPEPLVKQFMNESHYRRYNTYMSETLTRNLWALAICIFSIGGCFGGIFARKLATKVGRKRGCLANISLGIVAAALMILSRRLDSFETIVVARFLFGCHCGISNSLVLMYLSEISTSKTRGSIGTAHQVGIVFGMFLAEVMGFSVALGTADKWNILLGLGGVTCLMQAVILPFCPESPRFLLINRKDEQQCREALTTLRGSPDVDLEVTEIQNEMALCTRKTGLLNLLRTKSLRRPLLISVVLQLALQFSGISGIYFNSTSLFKEVVGSQDLATYTTSAVGGVMIVFALLTIPLMDRLGRRTLQLMGLGGIFACSVLITITLVLRHQVRWFAIASIVFVMLFVVFFTIGPGCVGWIMGAELFSHYARPAAMTVSVITSNLSTFVVGFIFPSLMDAIGNYVFLPFAVLTFLFFLFTFFFVPETKGRTLEEVSAIWRPKSAESRSNAASDSVQGDVSRSNDGEECDNPAFVESFRF